MTVLWMIALSVLVYAAGPSGADDWPQWLGPNRDNSSSEKVAPWTAPPKVLWRQPVGEGNSSPVVANGRVFAHAKVARMDEEEVTAFDARTGKILWNHRYSRAAFKSLYGNGPRATPAVSGDHIYTFGITGVLSCFDVKNGKQVWQVDALKTCGAANLFFGASCSPLIEGDKVLVNVGAKGASVVAFRKDDGTVVWKSQDDRASYSSPIAFDSGNQRQVVFLTGQGLISLFPSDGKLAWKFPLIDLLMESSTTPVKAGDILVAGSITYGSVGLRLESKDGNPGVKQLWKNDQLTCYFSTPVAVGPDHLYIVTGTKPPALRTETTLHCIEIQTGKELWQKPKVGQYHASLLRTGNDKLLMLEDTGSLVLLDPNPKEYRELARTSVCGSTWAHPALSNGRLYVRDEKELICLQLAASE
jgi:outer membrane protein assembly factor BamB